MGNNNTLQKSDIITEINGYKLFTNDIKYSKLQRKVKCSSEKFEKKIIEKFRNTNQNSIDIHMLYCDCRNEIDDIKVISVDSYF